MIPLDRGLYALMYGNIAAQEEQARRERAAQSAGTFAESRGMPGAEFLSSALGAPNIMQTWDRDRLFGAQERQQQFANKLALEKMIFQQLLSGAQLGEKQQERRSKERLLGTKAAMDWSRLGLNLQGKREASQAKIKSAEIAAGGRIGAANIKARASAAKPMDPSRLWRAYVDLQKLLQMLPQAVTDQKTGRNVPNPQRSQIAQQILALEAQLGLYRVAPE